MAILATDADPRDFLETVDDAGSVVVWRHQRAFGLMARQIDGGAAITVREPGGALICIAGLYADGDTAAEGWFQVGPAMRRNIVAAVRGLKHTLEAVGREAGPLTVRAYVREGGVAGTRLALMLGFEPRRHEMTAFGPALRFEREFA